MAEFNQLSINLYLLCLTYLIEPSCGYEENCDYLDTSRKDRTNHLVCNNYGCCGHFSTRHCCVGPLPMVAGIFGALLLILLVVVIVVVCCTKYKHKQRAKRIPIIIAEMYNDIPLPSAPPVYNTARLHPPPLLVHPFRHTPSGDSQLPPPASSIHPPRITPLE